MSTSLPFEILAITDQSQGSSDLKAISSSGGALLFRDKTLPPSARLELGRRLREETRRLGIPLLVHGDPALARTLHAEGVHLPASAVPRSESGLWVGCSCHTASELSRASAAGVDYATLSPVFASPGKGTGIGWRRFSELAVDCPIPVFALGGVGPEDLRQAQNNGAWGIAGIRAFLS